MKNTKKPLCQAQKLNTKNIPPVRKSKKVTIYPEVVCLVLAISAATYSYFGLSTASLATPNEPELKTQYHTAHSHDHAPQPDWLCKDGLIITLENQSLCGPTAPHPSI